MPSYKKHIFTTSPGRINLAGSVSLALFDKTGTLTVDGLTLRGVIPKSDTFNESELISDVQACSNEIQSALGACNSLSKTSEGKLIGDPLDVEIFQASQWTFEQKESEVYIELGNRRLYQLKTIPFSFELKRQSSIVKDESGVVIFTKGAPEVIKDLCINIPPSYNSTLDELSSQGLRVIAIARRELVDPFDHSPRELLETEMTFLGLIVLSNQFRVST